jgi:hypothetical protein
MRISKMWPSSGHLKLYEELKSIDCSNIRKYNLISRFLLTKITYINRDIGNTEPNSYMNRRVIP